MRDEGLGIESGNWTVANCRFEFPSQDGDHGPPSGHCKLSSQSRLPNPQSPSPRLCLSRRNQASEMLERSVEGLLRGVGKKTAGQLPRAKMIAQTLATDPFSRTRRIAAIAPLRILRFAALHKHPPSIAFPRDFGMIEFCGLRPHFSGMCPIREDLFARLVVWPRHSRRHARMSSKTEKTPHLRERSCQRKPS